MYTDDKVTAYITSKELLFNIETLDELRNLKVNFGRRLESRTALSCARPPVDAFPTMAVGRV